MMTMSAGASVGAGRVRHRRGSAGGWWRRRIHTGRRSDSGGTRSSFAPLPNATGKLIKTVQRIPVKIVLDGPAEWARAVSPGVSAEATVTHCIAWLAGGRFSKVN
jgi:hypothetical protein